MQWSQLKKRIEDTFADSVKGRVEIWATRYRGAHDNAGEAWITFDKKRVVSTGEYKYLMAHYQISQRLKSERNCLDYRDPQQIDGYLLADNEAKEILTADGVFDSWHFNRCLFEFLNCSIDDALISKNPIIRAFAMLDKRFGKRRITNFNVQNEHPLVVQFYQLRCTAEGIELRSEQA